MKTYRHNFLTALLLLFTVTAFAQNKKLDKTYNTNKDVKIILDARHTNVSFETWDRNEVVIEASLDANLKGEEVKALLNNWKLETTGTPGEIRITSGGGVVNNPDIDMAGFAESMAQMQNLIAPIMNEMVAPMLENLAQHPPLPPDFAAKMGNLSFDYEAYQKDGDKYIKKWEAQIEKNFGKDFEASMEKWAEQFEKNAKVWEKNASEKMEISGENFEKSMEAWGEKFGAQMEAWGENFARQFEGMEGNEQIMNVKPGTKANRNIKIKMPAGARLELDVRHGDVKLGQRTSNLKANLSHSSLTGNIVDGQNTEVKVSYSPVNIAQWNYGVLNAGYGQKIAINKARSIKLISNSSDVNINEIGETAILSGSFGSLKIGKLSPDFKNLDITVKNSDLNLILPQTALNFNYNGTQSKIEYPKVATIKSSNSYDNQLLNGFYQSASSNRNISINATFSNIIIK
ncbi:MAG TPA: hypothetical protein VLN46_03990 [Gillisia sp.]|nr:hypothetical protein [Gillisia sp.]